MKTIKNLLFVAFAATAISACQKEMEDQKINSSENLVTFTATSDDIVSKTTIWYEEGLEEESFTTRLMTSDHVAVNGKKSTKVNKKNNIGSVVSFTVDNVTAPYYVVTATHLTFENDLTTLKYDSEKHQYEITFSATQNYRLVNSGKTTSHHSTADILAAYSDDENLNFRHLSTLLAININVEKSTVNENIKKVYIRQGNGDYISGQWLVKYDSDNNEPYLEPVELDNSIVYNCVTNDYSPEGVPQDKVMLVAVPSYNYTNGLIITIEGMSGKSATFKMNDTDFSNKGGKIIPFKPSYTPVEPRTIKSQDDWNNFAAQYNSTGSAYPYINDGVVTLEKDITVDALNPIKRTFNFIFDGKNNTITLNNATKPLFESLSGEIRDLTLAGSLDLGSISGAPFVNTLKVGGKISGCTNNMSVECSRRGHTYVSGLVSVMEGGTIENCTNNGTVDVTVDVDNGFYNVAVAGIVADIRVTDSEQTISLTDCTNSSTAALTLYPQLSFKATKTTNTKGMQLCGFGGIAGYIRNPASYTFTNCDNHGVITLSASKITHANGNSPRTISVGGVVGLAAPCPDGLMIDPGTDKYPKLFDITLDRCDNDAYIYNYGVNYSSTEESKNKVFTGGLAGSLAGTSENYADIKQCSNTGDVITHNYTSSMANLTPSGRTAYCPVAGGLIGYGAYLDIDDCTIECQIGDGKRQMAAWGGVIGYAIRAFKLKNSTIDVMGYFAGCAGYDMNRAVVAVVPVKWTAGDSGEKTMDLAPDISGSEISDNDIACLLYTLPSAASTTSTADLSSSVTVNTFDTEDLIKENLVCGEGFSANNGVTIGDGNTYIVTTPAN